MAQVTLENVADTFPVGTIVGAYELRSQLGGFDFAHAPNGAQTTAGTRSELRASARVRAPRSTSGAALMRPRSPS